MSIEPQEFRVVPIGHLFIDWSYHQAPPRRFVDRIANGFDPLLVGQLVVNLRPGHSPHEGRFHRLLRRLGWRDHPWYSVIDGATRAAAAYEAGCRTLPCLVMHLPVEGEVAHFHQANRRRPPCGSWSP